MTDAIADLPGPILSPVFGRARTISRVLWGIFSVFFALILLYLLCIPLLVVAPMTGIETWFGTPIPLSDYSLANRLLACCSQAIAALSALFLLHHARKLFGSFARGEVFSVQAVAHIRGAGLWLVLSACAAGIAKIGLAAAAGKHPHLWIEPQTVVFGVTTFVAAYVMAEARRIADENASIL